MAEESSGRLLGVKLGFIGAGSMGGALIRGLVQGGWVARENLIFYDPDPNRLAEMETLGVEPALDNPEVMHAQVVVLAVKPQVVGAALGEIKEFARSWHLIISIAAGVPLGALEAAFPESRVIRAMPNTPALVGAGMTALSPGSRATQPPCTSPRIKAPPMLPAPMKPSFTPNNRPLFLSAIDICSFPVQNH